MDAKNQQKLKNGTSGNDKSDSYTHITAVHDKLVASPLSNDNTEIVSFQGFRVLGALVLIVGNLRLAIENLLKYGVLMRFDSTGIPASDLKLGTLLFLSIPLHLFVALAIESHAAHWAQQQLGHSKKDEDGNKKQKGRLPLKQAWNFIAFLHSINAMCCLLISTFVVYNFMWHPVPGLICQVHAVILCLKVASYALTNRDLRDAYLHGTPVPRLYVQRPYPSNVTFSNVLYFWWAPTLICVGFP